MELLALPRLGLLPRISCLSDVSDDGYQGRKHRKARNPGNGMGYLPISRNMDLWKTDVYAYPCFEDIHTLSFRLQKSLKFKKILNFFVNEYIKNYGSYHNDIFSHSYDLR